MHSKTIRKEYIHLNTSGERQRLKVGFERRRHIRTYRHERYVNMRGKTQVIEPTWIGPTEVEVGTKLIKVRLDIGEKPLSK